MDTYDDAISSASQTYGIDPGVLKSLLHQESSFDPKIISGETRSKAGAIGIAQFMPATAKQVGIDPTDPIQSIFGAAQYLKSQVDKFGSLSKGIAAYNWGEGNLGETIKEYGDNWVDALPPETKDYLSKVAGRAITYRQEFADRAPVTPVAAPIVAPPIVAPVAAPKKDEGVFDALVRGGKEAFQQLPELAYGVGAIGASAVESAVGEGGLATGAKQYLVGKYSDAKKEIESQSQSADSIDYSWDQAQKGDYNALVHWAAHGFGYVGAQGAQMLLPVGIGKAAGQIAFKYGAAKIIGGMVTKEAARIAELETAGLVSGEITQALTQQELQQVAVKNVTEKFADYGTKTAMAGHAFGMEGGEIGGDLSEKLVKENRPATGSELAKAGVAILGAGGLEYVKEVIGLDILMGKSRFVKGAANIKGIPGRIAGGAIAAAIDTPIEAGQEYFQTGLEEYGKGNEKNILPFNQSLEGQRQAREAAALGALGGLSIGFAGGAIHRPNIDTKTIDPNAVLNSSNIDDAINKSMPPNMDEQLAAVIKRTTPIPDATSGAIVPGESIDTNSPYYTSKKIQFSNSALGDITSLTEPLFKTDALTNAPIIPLGNAVTPSLTENSVINPTLDETGATAQTITGEPLRTEVPETAPFKEQRIDAEKRILVSEMTNEQKDRALLEDELTKIPNLRAKNESPRLAVQANIDLDGFKPINDNFSHAAGDEVLKVIAQHLQQSQGDGKVYRVGGDEFSAEFNTQAEAVKAMETARAKFASTVFTFQLPDGTQKQITGLGFSYGLGENSTVAENGLIADKAAREKAGLRSQRYGTLAQGNSELTQGQQTNQREIAQNELARAKETDSERMVRLASLGETSQVDADVTAATQQAAPNETKPIRTEVSGIPVSVAVPRETIREGVSANGNTWAKKVSAHYASLTGTISATGQSIKAFLGPTADNATKVFIVDQVKADRSYDEPKVMIGYKNIKSARDAYMLNYPTGWKGLGGITEMPMAKFREWVKTPAAAQPVSEAVRSRFSKVAQTNPNEVVIGSYGVMPSKNNQPLTLKKTGSEYTLFQGKNEAIDNNTGEPITYKSLDEGIADVKAEMTRESRRFLSTQQKTFINPEYKTTDSVAGQSNEQAANVAVDDKTQSNANNNNEKTSEVKVAQETSPAPTPTQSFVNSMRAAVDALDLSTKTPEELTKIEAKKTEETKANQESKDNEIAAAQDVIDNANNATDQSDTNKKPTLYSRGSIWYSQMSRQIESLMGKQEPSQELAIKAEAWAKAGKYKADELQSSGLTDWLKLQDGKVTKQQVMDYLEGNGVRVEEVMMGERTNEDPAGVLARSKIFNKYESEIQGLYREMDSAANRNEQEKIQDKLIDVQQKRDKEADAAYVIPDDTPTKFQSYQTLGGENYRELLLTLPDSFGAKPNKDGYIPASAIVDAQFRSSHFDQPNILAHVRFNERTDADGNKVLFVEEIQSDWAQAGRREGFKGGAQQAFDKLKAETEKKYGMSLIDLRRSDRSEEKMRALDEIDRAYKLAQQEVHGSKVSPGPFVGKTEAWVALSLKRMIRYAAENGFDKIAWTNGEQQAARYDLSKQVRRITYESSGDGNYKVRIFDLNNDAIKGVPPILDANGIEGYVGKEIAKQIVDNATTELKVLSGENLRVGGEGMKSFYDKIVPNVANDVLKKLGGGKVGEVRINIKPEEEVFKVRDRGENASLRWDVYNFRGATFSTPFATHHEAQTRANEKNQKYASKQMGFDITPAMRDKAMAGMPLFSRNTSPSNVSSAEVVAWLAGPISQTSTLVNVLTSEEALLVNKDLPSNAAAWFDPSTGKVNIVSDRVQSKEHAEFLFFHEIFHSGVNHAQFQEIHAAMNQVALQNKNVRAAAADWMAAYGTSTVEGYIKAGLNENEAARQTRAMSIEEALADLSGDNVEIKGINKVIAAIQSGLRKLGFNSLANWMEGKSNAEALELIRAVRGAVMDNVMVLPASAGQSMFSRAAQTATAAFKNWFGDSKVVDKNGEPLVVYHGTNADIQAFAGDKVKGRFPNSEGFYFTSSQSHASVYADSINNAAVNFDPASRFAKPAAEGGNVIPVYVSMQNPKLITVSKGGTLESSVDGDFGARVRAAREAGHDGVIVTRNAGDEYDGKLVIAFKPEQVKSAIGNNGNFDGKNPNVLYSRGEVAEAAKTQAPDETRGQALQRVVQDKDIRFKVVQEWLKKNGVNLSEMADVYTGMGLYPGRVAVRVEDFRDLTFKPIVGELDKAGFTVDDAVNFLHAQHALERNPKIAKINPKMQDGGAGMSNAVAKDIVAKTDPKLIPIANKLQAITKATLLMKLQSGLIDQAQYDRINSSYDFYVGLKGGGETIQSGTGKGFDIKDKMKRALGHSVRDEKIVENILHDHEVAIFLAQKQRVFQTLVQFALETNDPNLITINAPEKRAVLMPGESVYEVRYNGSTVGTYNSVQDARSEMAKMIATFKNNVTNESKKFSIQRTQSDGTVQYKASPMLAENEVGGYLNGQFVRMQINDPLMARSYKNLGVDHLVGVLKVGREVNTFLSKAYTGNNPAFLLKNAIRDSIEGVINLTGDYGLHMTGKVLAHYPSAFVNLVKYATTGKASPMIADYRSDGSTTGAAYLGDLDRVGDDVRKVYNDYAGMSDTYRREGLLSAGKVASDKTISALTHFIEVANAVSENAMRLATYETLRENGYSRNKAALAAKDVTLNFNRKGEIGTQASALYLFFNPSVQGAARLVQTMLYSEHKVQAWALTGALTALFYAMAAANADADKKRWDETADYDKAHNLIIPAGKYQVKIPIPYGYGFFGSLGTAIHEIQNGKDIKKVGYMLANAFAEGFSPIGNPVGDKPDYKNLAEILPFTPIKVGAEIGVNRSGLGGPIYPENQRDGKPDSSTMFRSTKGTIWDAIATKANSITGGNKAVAGWADVHPDTLKSLWATATGGTGRFVTDTAQLGNLAVQGATPELREVPILRDFFTESKISGTRKVFYDAVEDAKRAQTEFATAKKNLEQVNSGKDQSAKKEARETLDEVLQTNRALLGLGGTIMQFQKVDGIKRDQMEAVMADTSIPLQERRTKVREMEVAEKELYDRFIKIFQTKEATQKEDELRRAKGK